VARTERLVLKLVTAATADPVTLTEAKAHMRVDIADDDTLIGSLITSATQHIEHLTRRQLMPATWRLSLDGFPGTYKRHGAWMRETPEGTDILLPRPALTAITHIKYTDMAGVVQTLSTDVYAAQTDEEPGRVTLKYGQSWPEAQDIANSVVVTYTAGYSTGSDVPVSQAAVPKAMKQAILMLASYWYEHRETVLVGSISKELDFAVTNLCAQFACAEVW
jgi:uncharacterized phiE125 gp8 family phage protein